MHVHDCVDNEELLKCTMQCIFTKINSSLTRIRYIIENAVGTVT